MKCRWCPNAATRGTFCDRCADKHYNHTDKWRRRQKAYSILPGLPGVEVLERAESHLRSVMQQSGEKLFHEHKAAIELLDELQRDLLSVTILANITAHDSPHGKRSKFDSKLLQQESIA